MSEALGKWVTPTYDVGFVNREAVVLCRGNDYDRGRGVLPWRIFCTAIDMHGARTIVAALNGSQP